MHRIVFVIVFSLAPALAYAEQTTLTQAQWQGLKPRNGETVAALAPLHDVVVALDKKPSRRLVIRYPGGDAGTAWAKQVRDWLVALGVAGARIRLEPGTASADALTLLTRDGTGSE